MRADVKHMLSELIGFHRSKLALVQKLADHCVALSSYAVSQDFASSDDLLSEDVFITAQADLYDFKITTVMSKLCIVTGMEPDQLETYLIKNCTEGAELQSLKDAIRSLLADAYMQKIKLDSVMEREICSIKKSIADLSAMQRVRKYAPDSSPLL